MNNRKTAVVIILIVLLYPFRVGIMSPHEYSNTYSLIMFLITIIGLGVAVYLLEKEDKETNGST